MAERDSTHLNFILMILKIKKVCILLLSCVLFLNFSCDSISQNEKSDKTNEPEIPPSVFSEFEIYSYGRDSSVFLKWKEPSSVSFSNIKIQYKKTADSSYLERNDVSQSVKQYNVSGLENDCEYDFIFSASGSDGKNYEKKLKQTPCAFEFTYFYDTALIAGNGKTYISFALEGNCQEISDFHVYRESNQKEVGDYTVTKDILAYEEIDKEQASTDQTKTFEKYYSILIEDESASSEMSYLIRAVNSKNQESKEHSIKSRKLNLPSVSVNLGLSEENFEAFKKKEKINATLSVFSKDNPLADVSLTIKGRGNSSWFNAPKKSYTIKFKEKQKFLGFDSNKSFALIANYFDKNFSKENKLTIIFMVAGSTLIFELGAYFINSIILEFEREFGYFIKIVLIEILYNILLSIILYPLIQKFGYSIERIFKKTNILTRYF